MCLPSSRASRRRRGRASTPRRCATRGSTWARRWRWSGCASSSCGVSRAIVREARGLSTGSPDEALGMAVLAGAGPTAWRGGFGRGSTRLRRAGARGVAGRGVEAGPAFVVAVDAEERREGRQRGVMIRAACELDPAWLLDLFPDEVIEQRHARVERRQRARRRRAAARLPGPGDRRVAGAAGPRDRPGRGREARRGGPRAGRRSLRARPRGRWRPGCGRVDFVARTVPEAKVSPPDAAAQEAALRALCVGCRSLDELRGQSLLEGLRGLLTGEQRRAVELHAPERVMLRAPCGTDSL
jgi:hypothetical protein